jgi:hypothetical protein
MKKLFLLTLISGVFLFSCKDEEPGGTTNGGGSSDPLAVGAVAETNTSYIVKFTGTNCPPCGSWGWAMFTEFLNNVGVDGVYSAAYSDNFVAALFITNEATSMDGAYGAAASGSGYPTFAANGESKLSRAGGQVNTTNEKQMVYDAVNNHAGAAVKINTGLNWMVEDGKIKIKYKTKAFEAVSGAHLAIFIQENGVVGNQAGHSEGQFATHKHVLRKSVDGAFGKSLGDLTAGQEVEGEAEVQLGAEWNGDNIEVIAIMNSKSGTNYTFLNAALGTDKG